MLRSIGTYKSHFADDFHKVGSVNKVRNLQAGLLRLSERGKKMADPVNTKSKLKLMWTEILDVVRNWSVLGLGRLLRWQGSRSTTTS